jgi:SNF2 family DNA or RNA helicase
MKLLAKVIQLLPLNIASMHTSTKKPAEIDARIQQGINFLKVFANNQIVEDYELVVPVKANLRQYQREGINWMA